MSYTFFNLRASWKQTRGVHLPQQKVWSGGCVIE